VLRLKQRRQAELCRFNVADGGCDDSHTRSCRTSWPDRHSHNNAGISVDNLLLRLKEEEWDRVINVNLKGVFRYKAVIRPMPAKGRGIINLTSVAQTGNAGQAAYTAKAGIVGFTKTMAKELASRSITVNAVAPGFIETDMTGSLPEQVKSGYLSLIPANRWGTAAEVAEVVTFLAGPLAGYITGQTININGGMYM
jgi:3-oxoacyl-[acyl-carrier protein] reductase